MQNGYEETSQMNMIPDDDVGSLIGSDNEDGEENAPKSPAKPVARKVIKKIVKKTA
jgi:hypothetical protein